MKYLRPLLAIYGAGIVGTFGWLFYALSGITVCASYTETCRIVLGRSGQLALIWPAYWGGRISGTAAMTPLVSVKVVVVAVLVFFTVLLLALAYTRILRAGSEPARDEPGTRAAKPNRRDQSQDTSTARGARP